MHLKTRFFNIDLLGNNVNDPTFQVVTLLIFCRKIHFSLPGSIFAHYFSVLKSIMVQLKERARGFGVLLGYTLHHPAHLLNFCVILSTLETN